jgi:ABC-type Fe3+ transport system substrate-binding protein
MKRAAVALTALALVLALPFVARSRRRTVTPEAAASERIIVLTPHNEAVRYEFGRAFSEHMAAQGRLVEIDWRTPGGTAEIARYLAAECASPSGCGADLLFGGGSVEHIRQAAAGHLADSGIVARHPDLFGPGGIPQTWGGRPYWDPAGRWLGTCLSSFGICFNRDSLARLGVATPTSWEALADPRLLGQLALADPSKSGSVATTFETIVQAQMQHSGVADGWARAMRLIRRIGGNARYFTEAAAKVPLDVAAGDAAAGLCIDFYGRFQSEATAAAVGQPGRVGFSTARGETPLDPDPISLLRGAPHRELAIAFMEFVLSEAGQKIWGFRVGAPGGPERYALRRLPILPALYAPDLARFRSDPDENPYAEGARFEYREAWTGPLFGAIAFVIRTMCVDTEPELAEAYGALAAARFPPQATALFDDLTLVDYATVSGPLRAALKSHDPLVEAAWSRRLVRHFRDLYRRATALARAGQ